MRAFATSYQATNSFSDSFGVDLNLRVEDLRPGDFQALQSMLHSGGNAGDYLPTGQVVVKCGHCGQWGARKCACKFCGAPID